MINKIQSLEMYKGDWVVSTAPEIEPVTVAELKTFARIDTTAEDAILENYIESARRACEIYLGRALIEQTIKIVFDTWTELVIELPMPPLISITGVYTVDESDTATLYSSSKYYVVTESIPGKLVIKQGVTQPENTARYSAGFYISYKAGYGDAVTDVPRAIRDALLLWATSIYETRSLGGEPPPEAKKLLSLYRLRNI